MSPVRATTTVVVTLLLALAGCSSDDETPDAGPTTTAATTSTTTAPSTTTLVGAGEVPVREWAEGFCADFGTWQDQMGRAGRAVTEGLGSAENLEEAKVLVVAAFDRATVDTEELIIRIEAAGAPVINDGEALVDDFIARFTAIRDAVVTARGEAQALGTDDPDDFAAQVDAFGATYAEAVAEAGRSFGDLDRLYPSIELQRALSASCEL